MKDRILKELSLYSVALCVESVNILYVVGGKENSADQFPLSLTGGEKSEATPAKKSKA